MGATHRPQIHYGGLHPPYDGAIAAAQGIIVCARNGRLRRMLVPLAHELESRRLLSVAATFLGFTDVDLTGPTAAPGPDGTQSLHIQVTGLSLDGNQVEPIDGVTITGPTGFNWTYGITPSSPNDANQQAGPGVQVVLTALSGGSSGDADIYFSPVVQQIGSTGQISYATLPNNSTLSGTVY